MSENRMLWRIFGPNRVEVKGKRKLHMDVLHNSYCSINIAPMINSKRMRWIGYVACVGRREIHAGFWWVDLNDTDYFEDLEGDGGILRTIARKLNGRTSTGLILLI